jgi:hypothetical protein
MKKNIFLLFVLLFCFTNYCYSDNDSTKKSQTAEQKEILFWETIKDSKDTQMFEAYLEQYPKGSFVPLAEIYKKKYKSSNPPKDNIGNPLPGQVWIIQLTGYCVDEIKLEFFSNNNNQDTLLFNNPVNIKFSSSPYGNGYIKGNLKGKINKGKLEGTLKNGYIYTSVGGLPIQGKMDGMILDKKGERTYSFYCSEAILQGEWILERQVRK